MRYSDMCDAITPLMSVMRQVLLQDRLQRRAQVGVHTIFAYLQPQVCNLEQR